MRVSSGIASYAEPSISIRDQQCRVMYLAGRWYPTLGCQIAEYLQCAQFGVAECLFAHIHQV
jgi:hypothetical protein